MKLRRVRFAFVSAMVDIVFPFRKMSTKPDQSQISEIIRDLLSRDFELGTEHVLCHPKLRPQVEHIDDGASLVAQPPTRPRGNHHLAARGHPSPTETHTPRDTPSLAASCEREQPSVADPFDVMRLKLVDPRALRHVLPPRSMTVAFWLVTSVAWRYRSGATGGRGCLSVVRTALRVFGWPFGWPDISALTHGRWERVRDGWPEPASTIAPLLCAGVKGGELWGADARGVHRSDDGGKSWRRAVGYATSPT